MPSYRDYMLIDNPNELSDKELRKAVSKMSSVANKRLRRMEEKDIYFGEGIGKNTISGVKKFGVKGKSDDEVIREFKRVRNFLANEQSSLTGMYRVYREFKEGIIKGRKRVSGIDEDSRISKGKDKADYNKMLKQKESSGMKTDRTLSKYEELQQWRKLWTYYNRLVEEGYYTPSEYDSSQVREGILAVIHTQYYSNLSDEETYKRIIADFTHDYEKRKEEEENSDDVSTSSLIFGQSD